MSSGSASSIEPSVLLAHEEVLELGADLELVAERLGAVELAAEDRARAVRPLLALDVHVAGEARDARPERQRRELRTSGIAAMSGMFGRWPMSPAANPANPAPSVEQVVEVRGRDELRVRLAVHVDELREQELDAVGADVLARLVGRRRAA